MCITGIYRKHKIIVQVSNDLNVAFHLYRGRGMGSVDGEETSRDSDTSPNYSRVETEAANMLGKSLYSINQSINNEGVLTFGVGL
jgi:hypothetical protein